MAEDIRNTSADLLVERRRAEIRAEALRQQESCLYTSTMIYMWLKPVGRQHKAVILIPIVLTALAGFGYIKALSPAWLVALMGFIATLVPSIAKALDIETHVGELKRLAGEYKSLQDRFRQLAQIGVHREIGEAEAKLNELMDRLDVVRSVSLTPPERYFQKAQQKIKSGHYDFSVDLGRRRKGSRCPYA